MWITRRIGKNNETENSPFRAAFSKKNTKIHKTLANTAVL